MIATSLKSQGEGQNSGRHLHVRLVDEHTAAHDYVTDYLQAAGKAPDWYWRLAGNLGGSDPDRVDDLIVTAFEAGAYLMHEHPESLRFEWVNEEECERERKAQERSSQHNEERRKERATGLSHYA